MRAVSPVRPLTITGAVDCVVVPSPSWPLPLAPQHRAEPPDISAHVKFPPAATAVAPFRPTTATGFATLTAYAPFPSWPSLLYPQHLTDPFESNAHVCWIPAVTCVAFAQTLDPQIAAGQ